MHERNKDRRNEMMIIWIKYDLSLGKYSKWSSEEDRTSAI